MRAVTASHNLSIESGLGIARVFQSAEYVDVERAEKLMGRSLLKDLLAWRGLTLSMGVIEQWWGQSHFLLHLQVTLRPRTGAMLNRTYGQAGAVLYRGRPKVMDPAGERNNVLRGLYIQVYI